MDGLQSSVGAAPGLTFSYTPAEIQGLAEPTQSGSGHAHGHSHGHLSQLPGAGIQLTAARPALSPATFDSIEALIQQQQQERTTLPTATSPPKERPRVRGRMTPYAFFVMHRRDFYRQRGVPVQFTAFSKECSSLWRQMNDEEKQKYHKLAEEDKERYQREISGGYDKPLAKDGTRRGRRKKEPGQPKRNMCAFLHFCSEKRPKLKAENPSLSVGALAKQLSSAWKLMTPEQKRPYDEMAERDKKRYVQQKQAYEAGYSAAFLRRDLPAGAQAGGYTPMAPRHRRRRRAPDMPKRNMSAFMFFSLERRPAVKAENPTFGVGKLAQRLAVFWKEMGNEEKEPFQLMARKDKERYALQLKAYKRGLYSASSSGSTSTPQGGGQQAEEGDVDDESDAGEGDGEGLDQLVQFYQ